MRIKLVCDCGSAFTLTKEVKRLEKDILCPNCGKVLPPGATGAIKDFFESYKKLCDSLIEEQDHIITLKSLKLPKDPK